MIIKKDKNSLTTMGIIVDPMSSKSSLMKWIASVLLVLFASCSTPRVSESRQGEDVVWKKYHTYNFFSAEIDDASSSQEYSTNVALLKDLINAEMQKKGFVLSTSNPDLLINIGMVINEKVQTRETSFPLDAPRYMGQRRYSWKSEEVEVGRYNEGTITVDLVDKQQNTLVWKGAVKDVLPGKESHVKKSAQAGIQKLFKSFPIR